MRLMAAAVDDPSALANNVNKLSCRDDEFETTATSERVVSVCAIEASATNPSDMA